MAPKLSAAQSREHTLKPPIYIGGFFSRCFSVSMLAFTDNSGDGNPGYSLFGRGHGIHDRPCDKAAICCNRNSGERESLPTLCGTLREMRFAPPWLPALTSPVGYAAAGPAPEQQTSPIGQERPQSPMRESAQM